MTDTAVLFEPFQSPKLTLPNRIVMAPMTRNMAPGGVPAQANADYYRRRAEGGVGPDPVRRHGRRPAGLAQPAAHPVLPRRGAARRLAAA